QQARGKTMTEKKTYSGQADTLRQRAEDVFREKAAGMPENVEALSPDEVRQALHELRVHQIRLEMQNEELSRMQAELEASRARYFDLYDLAPIGYFTLSEAGLIMEVNLTAANMLGVARGALVKQPLTRFILPEDRDIYCRRRKLLFETGAPQMCEMRMVKKDAAPFWAQMEARLAQNAEGAPVCRAVMSDITARKRAEAELQQVHDELEHRVTERTVALRRANEERRTDIINRKRVEEIMRRTEENFRRSLDDSPLGVRIMTIEGETIYANRAILDIYGYDSVEELRTTSIKNRYTPQSYAEFEIRREKRKGDDGPSEYEISIVRKNGEIRHLQVFRKEVLWDVERQFQLIYQDITERKRAEQEVVETLQQLQETRDMLIQFEKHAAVGRLAAGVAHEILNPASVISSRLQFMEEENLSEPARENVKVCREHLQRIVKISHDLLQSSAKKPRVLVGGDLRRVIEVGLQMTERRRKEDHVQVEYNPLPEIIPVKMEMDSVVKVMVNLILNACDAMMGNDSKRMIVAAHRHEVTSTRPSVRLIVADNGHGIPAGDLDKIFEPFFTTKAPGKGTGLGLSVCKGIIQEHGGTIRAENNDIGGASFVVELPLFYP
ncbi:PAS domain S-box protein, partial [Patescibacteria group bacterium]|nr:PAS domain S-box protein [Patescibacteria group bacterium]